MMVVKLSFFFLKKMVNKNKNRSAMLLLILSGVCDKTKAETEMHCTWN